MNKYTYIRPTQSFIKRVSIYFCFSNLRYHLWDNFWQLKRYTSTKKLIVWWLRTFIWICKLVFFPYRKIERTDNDNVYAKEQLVEAFKLARQYTYQIPPISRKEFVKLAGEIFDQEIVKEKNRRNEKSK